MYNLTEEEKQKIHTALICASDSGTLDEFTKEELSLINEAEGIVNKLTLTDVGITLPSDTDLNNYKIDLKTPLDYFYYYHRPNMVDEQPAFRESLQKALNYVKGN
jgi:hypothetical protein